MSTANKPDPMVRCSRSFPVGHSATWSGDSATTRNGANGRNVVEAAFDNEGEFQSCLERAADQLKQEQRDGRGAAGQWVLLGMRRDFICALKASARTARRRSSRV